MEKWGVFLRDTVECRMCRSYSDAVTAAARINERDCRKDAHGNGIAIVTKITEGNYGMA